MPHVRVDLMGFTWVDGVCEHTSMSISCKQMPFRDAKVGDDIRFPNILGHSWYVKNSETTIQEVANEYVSDERFSDGEIEEVDPDTMISVAYYEYHKGDSIAYRLRFGDLAIGEVFSEGRATYHQFQWQKISDTSAYPTLETRDNELMKPYTLFLKADDMVIQWRRRGDAPV